MQSTLEEPAPDAVWQELAPMLDDAMAHLGETDRNAVVLRFFENKSLEEVGMALGLEQFYRRSMIGKLFIAMSEDSFAARTRGVATDRMRSLSYVLAGVLGALSGFAGGQLTFADFALGTALGLSGFIALAVGGIGSSVGAMVGGAVLGMLTSLTTHYFGAEYQKTIAIGLLILLLVVRPQGLFGTTQVRQV